MKIHVTRHIPRNLWSSISKELLAVTMSADFSTATGHFAHTRWTLVLRANTESPEGRTALSELCAAYYQPVFVFLRRMGFTEDVARDHAHTFFVHLLERGFPGVDPQRGRFRSYLLGAVKYFVGDLNDRALREKRGGQVVHEIIDPADDYSAALQVDDTSVPAMPQIFDREWAVAVMNRAVNALAAEHAEGRFAALRPWLMGDAAGSQSETAEALGMSEGAFKVAVHRLRKQFRERLRQEVAQTVSDDPEIDDELRYLCSVLAQ